MEELLKFLQANGGGAVGQQLGVDGAILDNGGAALSSAPPARPGLLGGGADTGGGAPGSGGLLGMMQNPQGLLGMLSGNGGGGLAGALKSAQQPQPAQAQQAKDPFGTMPAGQGQNDLQRALQVLRQR